MPRFDRFPLALSLALTFAAAARAEVVHIGNAELQDLLRQGVTVVDIRTPGEWRQTGVVAGSQLVQYVDEKGRLDPDAFVQQLNAVADPAKPVVLICRSGNRTGKAAQLLDAKSPQRRIYNVREGLIGWNRAGLPMVPLQQNLQQAGIRCTPAC
jgi:rhodanese-related sulfurtransferase